MSNTNLATSTSVDGALAQSGMSRVPETAA